MTHKKYKLIIGILALALVIAVVSALVMYAIQVPMSFSIRKDYGIGLYQDSACTIPLETLDFQFDGNGETVTIEAWIQNEGNIPLAVTYNLTNIVAWNYNTGNGNYFDSNDWYKFFIEEPLGTIVRPDIDASPTVFNLAVGAKQHINIIAQTHASNPIDPLTPVSATLNVNSNNGT